MHCVVDGFLGFSERRRDIVIRGGREVKIKYGTFEIRKGKGNASFKVCKGLFAYYQLFGVNIVLRGDSALRSGFERLCPDALSADRAQIRYYPVFDAYFCVKPE